MYRQPFQIIAACGAAFAASVSLADEPNLDFGVVDEPSYQTFRSAVCMSEFVRYDYVNAQRPRVVAAAAALVEFATRNPLADAGQLAVFVDAYDAALANHAPADPDLTRSSHFLSAARFARPLDFVPPEDAGTLDGTDTNVGYDVLDLLSVQIADPDGLIAMQDRMVEFDRARVSDFANARAWSQVLVVGFSGLDLHGNPNAHLAGALRSYLESEGFEPVPDGIDDARFTPVSDALTSSLPADFATYTALLNEPIETGAVWTSINDAFLEVRDASDRTLDDIVLTLTNEPTLIDGIVNADTPSIVDQLTAEYRARIDEVAGPRTVATARSYILMQASGQVNALGQQALDLSELQLETNEKMARFESGLTYASGALKLFAGFATLDAGSVISGLAETISGGVSLAESINGTGPPAPEQQIFDQIVETREQIEDVRVQMNQRFDRIETQLNTLYQAMGDGFDAVGDQIGDLQVSIDNLTVDVRELRTQIFRVRASLERIEEALYGLGDDFFLQVLTSTAEPVLDYRDDNGADLPYQLTSPNFVDGADFFHSWATISAKNSVFGGPQVSTLSSSSAATLLNGASIGREINALREYPAQLGLPMLRGTRVVGPGPWAQAAGAYSQLATESPWYFAYIDAQNNGQLQAVIDEGQALAATAAAGRDSELFDRLFNGVPNDPSEPGYMGALRDLATVIDNNVTNVLSDAYLLDSLTGEHVIDPWGGLEQLARDHTGATLHTEMAGLFNLNDLPLAPEIGTGWWNILGASRAPELTTAMILARVAQAGVDPENVYRPLLVEIGNNGSHATNDLYMKFYYDVDGSDLNIDPSVFTPDQLRASFVREVVLSFDNLPPIISHGDAEDVFNDDPDYFIGHVAFPLYLPGFDGRDIVGWTRQTVRNGQSVNVTYESDVFTETFGSGSSDVIAWLDDLQNQAWTRAAADPVLVNIEPLLAGYEALIESYVTLALPDLMERSTVIRAALRGNPATGELSLAFSGSLPGVLLAQLDDGDNGEFLDILGLMEPRALIAQSEIDDALTLPGAGHSYIDWTLTELEHVRDNAMTIAVDDTYEVSGGSLTVNAIEGVIANDREQEFRTPFVDLGTVALADPASGILDINADGSFTYTPATGFTGTHAFTYRTVCDVFACPDYLPPECSTPPAPPAPGFVCGMNGIACSDFATVVLLVDDAACDGDLTTTGAGDGMPGFGAPDGVTNIADLLYFLNIWQADRGSTPGSLADVTTIGASQGSPGYGVPDGEVDLSDLLFYINTWESGRAACPN